MSLPATETNDELLQPFLKAPTEEEEEATLTALLAIARPIIYNTLRRKAMLLNFQTELSEDLNSLVMMRVIEQLRKCKQSLNDDGGLGVIRNFPGLCQVIATTTVNEHLRLMYPRRASLQNQLLYVIQEAKDENALPLFALWRDVQERLCGFHAWQGQHFVFTAHHRLLEENAAGAMLGALQGQNASTMPLTQVLASLLEWLTHPAVFDSVVGTVARWRGIEDHKEQSLSASPDNDGVVSDAVSPGLSPEERAIFRDYLKRLWQNVTQLPPKQRAALLLNLCDAQGRGVLGFLPELGIVRFHEIATTLGLEAQEFMELWPRLPLEDREIAKLYDCTPAVVCVWRSRARSQLRKTGEEL